MSFLDNLERSLETMIEKTIIGGSGNLAHPVEIARAVWREITFRKEKGIDNSMAPNYFLVRLSREDSDQLSAVRQTIEDEIINYIYAESRKRDFSFIGPITMGWEVDEMLQRGSFRIHADFIEENIDPAMEEMEKILSVRALQILEGSESDNSVSMEDVQEIVIGRGKDCDLVLSDPVVSRKHARIFRVDSDYYIEDLGSKTGVYLEDQKIERTRIIPGQAIRIGLTLIKFV